jgi:hypothetical protein
MHIQENPEMSRNRRVNGTKENYEDIAARIKASWYKLTRLNGLRNDSSLQKRSKLIYRHSSFQEMELNFLPLDSRLDLVPQC